jgi:hypothetical protein
MADLLDCLMVEELKRKLQEDREKEQKRLEELKKPLDTSGFHLVRL